MNIYLNAALDYLRRGWAVVPGITVDVHGVCLCSQGALCDSPGKHPRVKWKPYQTTLPTEAEIHGWWRRWPDANVIILTGAQSGIVAVDIDPRHGGADSLASLGALPETLTSLTGGGGQHLIYRHPGTEMRNAAGLLPGIDFRGDGGYIVGPPSRHTSGRSYTWDVGQPEEPAPLPKRIVDLHRTAGGSVGADAASASRVFDEEKMLIDPIPEGRRNETLVRITGHYAADGRAFHDLLRTVLGCNVDLCQPPLPRDEVVALVESIYDAEQKKRQLSESINNHLNNGNGHDPEIPATDNRAMAARAWLELDVPGVVDWYIILGQSSAEYVLVTDENEARLGDDILNQTTLRRLLVNQLQVYLKPIENKIAWPKRAFLLRRLAREVYSEPTRASEQLDEWIAAYLNGVEPINNPAPDERLALLQTGAVIIDGRLMLKPEALQRYLVNILAEQSGIRELRRLLKRAGWESTIVGTGSSTTRAWAAPALRE